jgi:HEAT repeat protein
VIPALTRCVKEDPEPEVRGRAIMALAGLERRRKRPCPLVLIEAMLDPVDIVRWQAGVQIALFPDIAPGAAPVLLRGTKSDDPDVRGNILFPLATAARKDPKLLPALRERTKDKDWFVRDCAHIALYRATDQIDDYLAYVARERAAAPKAGPLRKDEAEGAKRLRAQRNLLIISGSALLAEWLQTRPKDVAGALGRMLEDEAAAERSAAANLLADFASMYRLLRGTPPAGRGKEGAPPPPVFPAANSPEVQAERAAHLAKQMQELGIAGRLRKLSERDPDPEVRRAAEEALKSLSARPAPP